MKSDIDLFEILLYDLKKLKGGIGYFRPTYRQPKFTLFSQKREAYLSVNLVLDILHLQRSTCVLEHF